MGEASKGLVCKHLYPQAASTTRKAVFWQQCPTATVTSTTSRAAVCRCPKIVKPPMSQSIPGFLRVKHQNYISYILLWEYCLSLFLWNTLLCFNISQTIMVNLPSACTLQSEELAASPPNPGCCKKAIFLCSFSKQTNKQIPQWPSPQISEKASPAWKIVCLRWPLLQVFQKTGNHFQPTPVFYFPCF